MNIKPLVLFSVIATLVISCNDKKKPIQPEVKSITESVYASGFIKSKNQYEVYGSSNGVIEKIFVTEGMQVKKGDTIFQLDNRNLKIATENARLSTNASNYKTNSDKLLDAKKAVTLAKKKLANDSLSYSRQKYLWNKNIGSKVELEQSELNYENSKVSLEVSKTNYSDLQRQLKLVSDQGENNLEIARIMEDNFIVRSEVDGVIYKINREEGEMVNGNDPAAIIGTEEFIIELTIDELDIVKIKKGQKVIIRMDSYKSQTFEAELTSIDPMMNSRTRSFQADAIFTKNPASLFPNLTVEANIIISVKKDALTIPRNYLINDSLVMLKGGKLQKVEIGLMDYELVEIKSGINKSTKLELPE